MESKVAILEAENSELRHKIEKLENLVKIQHTPMVQGHLWIQESVKKLLNQGEEESKEHSKTNPKWNKSQFDYMTRLYGLNGIERIKVIKRSFKSILDSIMYPASIYMLKLHDEGFNLTSDQYGILINSEKSQRELLIN